MTSRVFPLAPMCSLIRTVTWALMALPLALLASAVFGPRVLAVPAGLVVSLYAWVWLRFRPSRFVVHPEALEVVWPLKRRTLARADMSSVRVIDREELRQQVGSGTRVGAGGLWGGFGWLWTTKRGIVQMYVSRVDRYVWIERRAGRPWLITPAEPEAFVRALSGR